MSIRGKPTELDGELEERNAATTTSSFLRRRCPAITKRQWKRLAIDVALTVAAVVLFACSYFGVFPPQRRGFFCDDETIRYHYNGDTISLRSLFLISIGVPILFFLLVESKLQNVSLDCTSAKTCGIRSCSRRAGHIILDYFLGIVFGLLIVELLKVVVSELRPHFLDTCRPPGISENCTHKYISNYSCNSPFSKQLVLDSFKSFPSGHSAMAFYSAVFVIYYANHRLKDRVSRLFCPVLQLLTLTWAVYCSASRVMDHRHHWWDVLFGALMGIVIGGATAGMVLEKFQDSSSPNRSESAAVNEIASSQILLNTSSEHKDTNLTTMKDIDSNHI